MSLLRRRRRHRDDDVSFCEPCRTACDPVGRAESRLERTRRWIDNQHLPRGV